MRSYRAGNATPKRRGPRPQRRVRTAEPTSEAERLAAMLIESRAGKMQEQSRSMKLAISVFKRSLISKRIVDYTMDELDACVAIAALQVPSFYTLLNGIDAYFERRSRRLKLYGAGRGFDQDDA